MTTLRGTMLTPGVSRNGRLYTPELIKKAHDRLTERIADGQMPATMLTHHAAGDDSTRIVGQITKVALDGDNLTFEASLADTPHAQTIASLTKGKNPPLQNVSIRGFWVGPVISKTVEGRTVETADDLEIDGLDFTRSPGVLGARIDTVESSSTAESSGRVLIRESLDTVQVHKTPVDEHTHPTHADLGYRDQIRRFPISTPTEAHLSLTRLAEQHEQYTPKQVKRVRGRIKQALSRFGETMPEQTPVTETNHPSETSETRYSDISECYLDGNAGFSISAYNGPLTVNVSCYSGIDPKQLTTLAGAAMTAACTALATLDPDQDGDVDTPNGEDDDDMETAPTTKPADYSKTATVTTNTNKEADVAKKDTVTEATTTAAGTEENTVTDDMLAKVAEAAAKKAVKEYTKKTKSDTGVDETDTAKTDTAKTDTTDGAGKLDPKALLAEALKDPETRAALVETIRQEGLIGRKGIVEKMDPPAKPLHEMSREEQDAYATELWNNALPLR